MNKGKITQVIGPVVDVVFEGDPLPLIKEALIVQLNGAPLVMEVAQHMGNRVVRCIVLDSSEGLSKGMEVEGHRGLHQSAGWRFDAGPYV